MRAELRRSRAALLCSTALVGVSCLVQPASAQPAPNARPQGGQVVAGGAQINQTAPAATIVTQSTQRAAVDWRSFDVGAAHSVTFAQPGATAVILNRVTGPDPSAIAGQVSANGQVIITNPSGVVFHRGAQVNAGGIIVSAPGITNQNFMAGRMVFDQAPKRDARVENHGVITVKQAGLAALVAPAVVNSGVINARMGRVVLAGAATHTLDLYGDGLVSLDVTSQVREAPRGPDGQPVAALVTNTGMVRADGGVVQLTAAAADGVVSTLVRAGGRIQANSVGERTGRVEITGTGGSVIVEGRVAADGRTPGSAGGEVVLAADGMTGLAPSARVTASGQARGGVVAVGTTLARARTLGAAPAGTSARTLVAAGARVSADAKGGGDGGRVTVLSTQDTRIAGTLTARGGRDGGNGGTVELSGAGRFSLVGTADTSAPKGRLGTVVLDPFNLDIIAAGADTVPLTDNFNPNLAGNAGSATGTDTVTRAAVEGLTGNVRLLATNDIRVRTSLTLAASQSLTLEAQNNLTVEAGSTIDAGGGIRLVAASPFNDRPNPAGALSVPGNLTSRGVIELAAGTGGVTLGGLVASPQVLVDTRGPLTQTGGSITTGSLRGVSSSASLTSDTNAIRQLGDADPRSGSLRDTAYTVTGPTGDFALVNSVDMAIGSASPGSGVFVQRGRTASIEMNAPAANSITLLGTIGAPGGTIVLAAPAGVDVTATVKTAGRLSLTMGDLARTDASTLRLVSRAAAAAGPAGTVTLGRAGEALDFNANGGFNTLDLQASAGVTLGGTITTRLINIDTTGPLTQNGGSVIANDLVGTSGSVSLTSSTNAIDAVARTRDYTVTGVAGDFTLVDRVDLTVGNSSSGGALSVQPGRAIALTTNNLTLGGGINAAGGEVTLVTDQVAVRAGSINAPGGLVRFAPLTPSRRIELIRASETADPNSLSLSPGLLSSLNTGTLALGDARTSGVINFGNASTASNASERIILSGRAATLQLQTTGAVTQGAGVVLDVAGLVGASGSLALDGGHNISDLGGLPSDAPGTLTGYTTVGALTLTSNKTLNVSNVVSAGGPLSLWARGTPASGSFPADGNLNINAALRAPDITLAYRLNLTQSGGVITAPGTLTLASADGSNVNQAVGGSIITGRLTGQANSISLLGSANQIATLGPFTSTNNFVLQNGRGLTVVGPVAARDPLGSARDITMNVTGNLALNESVTGRTVTLNATTGVITQGPAGLVTAATLAGGADRVDLFGANRVGALGRFGTTGVFSLTNAESLTVTGPVSASAAALNVTGDLVLRSDLSAPTMTLTATGAIRQEAGLVSAPLRLTLAADGAVTQTGGSISAGLLDGRAGSLNLPSRANQIATLGPFTTSGDFLLFNGRSLTVAGPVDPGDVTLDVVGDLALNDSVTGTVVTLNATGAITEGPAGLVNAQTLTGRADRADLSGANRVGALGDFTTSTGFNLNDQPSLAVTGTVRDGRSVSILTDGSMILSGTVSAPITALTATGVRETVRPPVLRGNITQTAGLVEGSTSLTLTAAGTIRQLGGVITAGTLTGSSGDTTVLSSRANAVDTLGEFRSIGGFTLGSGRNLAVAGPVNDTTSVNLDITGDLALQGVISTGSLVANAGIITQPGGTIRADRLSGSSAGSASFDQAGNAIARLGPFASAGDFSVTDGSPISVTGAVRVGDRRTLRIVSDLTGFGSAGELLAPDGTVRIEALSPAGLAITGGGAPPIVANTLVLGTPTGGPVQINGSLELPRVSVLDLQSAGALTQTSGGIQVATLTGSGASATLTGSNRIGALSRFSTTGAFSLTNAEPLTVAGPVSASVAALNVTGDLVLRNDITAPTVTLAATGGISQQSGIVSAPLRLTLAAGGAVTQTGGSIVTGLLDGRAASLNLPSRANEITTLGPFTATNGFLLHDNRSLTVAGVNASSIGLDVTGDLRLDGSVISRDVTLAATGVITQPGGVLQAQSLSGSAGTASFDQPGNAITSLGRFTSLRDFSITDGRPLSVDGAVSAGAGRTLGITADTAVLGAGGALSVPGGTVRIAALTPAGLSVTSAAPISAATLVLGTPTGGPVTILGALNLPNVAVLDLQSAGALMQRDGAIQVATLTGNGASATLTGPNRIGTLGRFSTGGTLALTTASDLSVAGPVNAGALVLNVPNLTLSGPVTAGTFDVLASGSVTQAAGTLSTSRLTGSAGQGVSLGSSGTTSITELGPFTAGGALALQNAVPLTVTGPVQAPQLSVSAAGRFTLQGGAITTDGPNSVLRVVGGAAEFVQAGTAEAARLRPELRPGLGAAEFVQTGTTEVRPLRESRTSVRLELPETGGLMSLNNLVAPSTDLTLGLGVGRATGQLQAGSLLVVGSGGSANLTGSVAGQGGFTAAETARISPRFDQLYVLNGCAIQSPACVVIRREPPPVGQELSTIIAPQTFLRPQIQVLNRLEVFVTRDQDDPNLLLPNISDRDY